MDLNQQTYLAKVFEYQWQYDWMEYVITNDYFSKNKFLLISNPNFNIKMLEVSPCFKKKSMIISLQNEEIYYYYCCIIMTQGLIVSKIISKYYFFIIIHLHTHLYRVVDI